MRFLYTSVYGLFAVIAILLLAILIAFNSGCADSPMEPDPEQNNFYISSIVFTGDSTGEYNTRTLRFSRSQICREESKGEPYCEITISWIPPEADSIVIYTIYRSTDPGIESGSTSEDIVGTTTDSVFADSNSLEWGVTYYYAVTGLTTDSTLLWSNEDSIGTPNCQFPTPSILTAEDLPFGRCILSWSECPDDDFASYVLIRQQSEFSFLPDTLGVFSGLQETTYTDSVLPSYSPRYYKIITTDTQGLSVESDVLEYISGFGLPWCVCFCSNEFTYMPFGGLISSPNEDFIYFGADGYLRSLYRLNTDTGSFIHFSSEYCSNLSYVYAPQQNCLLLSPSYSSQNCVELRDEYTLEILDQLELPFNTLGILALPTGSRAILSPWGYDNSIVLDVSNMELVDTVDYVFHYGQVLEGFGTYIMGRGPLRRIDPTTLQVVATSTINLDYFTELMVSNSGELCLISNCCFYELDPYSLSVINSTPLPMSSFSSGTLIEAQGTVYAYIFEPSDPSIRVYDTETLELIGQVSNLPDYRFEWPPEMITLHSRQEIWCRYFSISAPNGIVVFNISL